MSVKISRILHAGYIFSNAEAQILFDPIFENPFSLNCYAFPDVHFEIDLIKRQKFLAVFISHFHDDHCSLMSLNLIDRLTPIYLYCLHDEMFELIRELGFKSIHRLEINQTISVDKFKITPRRALDADVDSIFHIQILGLNILNVVDSWIDEQTLDQLRQFAPWDLILWPFQRLRETEVIAPFQADLESVDLPLEWVGQLKILNPRYIVPSSCQFIHESWSWYNQQLFPISYLYFNNWIKHILPDTHVIRLNPSVSIRFDQQKNIQFSESIPWMVPVGPQNVDYIFVNKILPSTTAEIASHFTPLTDEQKKIIFEYCATDIVSKYNTLTASDEAYFQKKRYWRLFIYDHTGSAKQFNYIINAGTMQIAEVEIPEVSWQTEIPMAKLYSALFYGEALTSLYLRVNATEFSKSTEADLKDVEITEDPLIRCLYQGVFAAYQLNQLRQITNKIE